MLNNLRKFKKDDTVVLTGVEVKVSLNGKYRNMPFKVFQTDDTRGPTTFDWEAPKESKGRATSYNQAIERVKEAIDYVLDKQ